MRSSAKAEFLKSLEGASERLTIFSGVDLLESGSYNDCITGCDAVLHTASPFFLEGASEDALVPPALEGETNPTLLFLCCHILFSRLYVSLLYYIVTTNIRTVLSSFYYIPHIYLPSLLHQEHAMSSLVVKSLVSRRLFSLHPWRPYMLPTAHWRMTMCMMNRLGHHVTFCVRKVIGTACPRPWLRSWHGI